MNLLRWAFFELRYLVDRAPWDTGISPPELQHFIDSHPPGLALDIGCGTGTNCLTLAKCGWRVTGIDFSWGAIRRARQRARQAGLSIDFRRGDVRRLRDLLGPFDLALDIGCYHALAQSRREGYARDLAAILRPGGTFLLYGFLAPDDASTDLGIGERELTDRFGDFEVTGIPHGTDRDRPWAWFRLRRTSS